MCGLPPGGAFVHHPPRSEGSCHADFEFTSVLPENIHRSPVGFPQPPTFSCPFSHAESDAGVEDAFLEFPPADVFELPAFEFLPIVDLPWCPFAVELTSYSG